MSNIIEDSKFTNNVFYEESIVQAMFIDTTFAEQISEVLNVSAKSRKRMFSVGMKPSKKILIPSRTVNGKVTTP